MPVRIAPAVLALVALLALPSAAGQAATSSSYHFVGGAPIVYTSGNQFVVIWRFNKAAPKGGANGTLSSAANISGVGYTGTPPADTNAGYGALTLDKKHYCYHQTIPSSGALRNAKAGSKHTVTVYVWSNTVKAKSTLTKGDTDSGVTLESRARALGCPDA